MPMHIEMLHGSPRGDGQGRARHPYREPAPPPPEPSPRTKPDLSLVSTELFIVGWSALRLGAGIAAGSVGLEETLAAAFLTFGLLLVLRALQASGPRPLRKRARRAPRRRIVFPS
jgi:hypothetical protein